MLAHSLVIPNSVGTGRKEAGITLLMAQGRPFLPWGRWPQLRLLGRAPQDDSMEVLLLQHIFPQ